MGGGGARGRAGGRRPGSGRRRGGRGCPPVFLEELVGLAEAVVEQHVDAGQRQLRVLDGQRRVPVLPPRRRLLRAGHDDEEAAGPSRLSPTYLPTHSPISLFVCLPATPSRAARCCLCVHRGKTQERPVPAEAGTRCPPPGRAPPALRRRGGRLAPASPPKAAAPAPLTSAQAPRGSRMRGSGRRRGAGVSNVCEAVSAVR